MSLRKMALAGLAVATGLSAGVASEALAQGEQFVPLLIYRTGPYAPNGIPIANAMNDYFTLVNERDGGVGGVKLTWEECETAYNNDRGVECYERLKDRGSTGASVVNPYSTGITYALIERATADKIPVLSMGYGRTDGSDGRVFPYVFTVPMTYWSQASALIKYIADQEGGLENLQGKKLALVYHDSAYGKEPIPTLEKLAETYGYELSLFPVAHPGPRAEVDLAQDRPAAQARLGVHVGLGCDELDRDQGGGGRRIPDGPVRRRLVVGLRTRRRAGRRCGGGLQERDLPCPGHRLPGVRGPL